MSRAINFFAQDEFYHIYNRGTEKRLIFLDKNDRKRFISLLYLCNSSTKLHRSDFLNISFNDLLKINRDEPLVSIGAYCLMSNHFHLLIKERGENGVSIFMQKISTAYTMYFNKRHKRSGALFQGRFKAQHLDSDNYLKYIFAYIHLNPIGIINKDWKNSKIQNKEEVIKYLGSYECSSYLDYLNESSRDVEGNILDKSAFPEYFQTRRDFKSYLNDWVELAEDIVKVEP